MAQLNKFLKKYLPIVAQQLYNLLYNLGRKQVRLFGIDLDSLYPNPLGSHGKTVQSR